MGIYDFYSVVIFNNEGFTEPLYYNDTTKRYVNMTYVLRKADWLESDNTKTFTYEKYY